MEALEIEISLIKSKLLIPNAKIFNPKAINPSSGSNFKFLAKYKIDGMNPFGINQSFVWMKYQMMMNQGTKANNITQLSTQSVIKYSPLPFSNLKRDSKGERQEKMIGKLTETERKKKVERYLQKRKRKSKAVRYE